MSNLAKDNDILRITDDCGEQSTLTVCSFFLVLSTLRVQNFVKRNVPEFWPHLGKFIHAKKNWNLWFGKVDPRKKNPAYSINEISSTRKKLWKLLLLFYQLSTFLLRMSSFIWRKKRCFQPIWRRTYLEELLYCHGKIFNMNVFKL